MIVIVEPVASSPTPTPTPSLSPTTALSSSSHYSITPTPTVPANSGVVVILNGINASAVSDLKFIMLELLCNT